MLEFKEAGLSQVVVCRPGKVGLEPDNLSSSCLYEYDKLLIWCPWAESNCRHKD